MIRMIRYYILKSKRLVCLFMLIDIRLKMQESDREFLHFLGSNRVPFVLVFTKTDKVSKSRMERNAGQYKNALLEHWETLPEIFITSAHSNKGREEILEFIRGTMDEE
jgi:GTP-binding protein